MLKYGGEMVLYFTWIQPVESLSIADTYLNVVSCHLAIKSLLIDAKIITSINKACIVKQWLLMSTISIIMQLPQ